MSAGQSDGDRSSAELSSSQVTRISSPKPTTSTRSKKEAVLYTPCVMCELEYEGCSLIPFSVQEDCLAEVSTPEA